MNLSTNSFKLLKICSLNCTFTGKDFGRSNAANILNKYKKRKIPTFNDDIQGTGIVVLGGIFGAMDITGGKN